MAKGAVQVRLNRNGASEKCKSMGKHGKVEGLLNMCRCSTSTSLMYVPTGITCVSN